MKKWRRYWDAVKPFVYVIGVIAVIIFAMYGIYELMNWLW